MKPSTLDMDRGDPSNRKRPYLRKGSGLFLLALLVAGIAFWSFKAPLRQDEKNRSLHEAIVRGDSQAVQIDLARGADPNTTKPEERPHTLLGFCRRILGMDRSEEAVTVLMEASQSGHPENVKMLLEAGANVNARDVEGYTPLFYATFCIGKEGVPIMRLLVAHGADVNMETREGAAIQDFARTDPDMMQILEQSKAEKR